MSDINYRRLRKDDLAAVREVASESWKHAYRNIFDDSYIKEWVEANYSLEIMRSILSDSDSARAFFYVAESEGRVIGFAHIGDRGNGWELLKIYLLPEHMGSGIGTRFIQLGEHFLRTKKASKYVVFVHKDNLQAIGFYRRNDFAHEPELDKKDINEQAWSKRL